MLRNRNQGSPWRACSKRSQAREAGWEGNCAKAAGIQPTGAVRDPGRLSLTARLPPVPEPGGSPELGSLANPQGRGVGEDDHVTSEGGIGDVSNPYGLTARELEVLWHIAAGRSDKEIAAQLTLSPLTVHKHVANILAKVGAGSRTEAATRALRLGFFDAKGDDDASPHGTAHEGRV